MKEEFIKLLKSTNREGMDNLLAFLEKSDFYKAPASTRFHGNYEGGLLEHSLKVYEIYKEKIKQSGLETPEASVIISALLHDICKTNFYKVDYRNAKNARGEWEKVPYYAVEDTIPYGHGEYNRMYQIVGSEGYVGKYPVQQICLRENATTGTATDYQNLGREVTYSGARLGELMEEYRNPILTPELEALAKEVGGHGGMDFIMDYRLIYCLRNGLPLDMDVYDMAEWCCLTELGKISIENGNAPVEVPDFTRGGWDQIDGFSYAFAE